MIALLLGGPANGEVRRIKTGRTTYPFYSGTTTGWISDHAQQPTTSALEVFQYRKIPWAKGPNGEAVFLVQG